MKKSKSIVLCSVLAAAIASCGGQEKKDDWIVGDEGGQTRDTTLNGKQYRHYGGFWYPLLLGRISPASYNGATASQIGRPGFTPTKIRTGGFGSSSRTVSG
jgi:hypothetical protein